MLLNYSVMSVELIRYAVELQCDVCSAHKVCC
jgi:hypothetical protein